MFLLSATVPNHRTLRVSMSVLSASVVPNRMFWTSVGILLIGCVIGAIAGANRPYVAPESWHHQVTAKLAHWPSWSAFAIHNIGIAILAALGRFTGGVLAGLLIFLTGYTVGGATTAAYVGGYPLVIVAALLVPHGIVELWGLLLAASFGLQGGDFSRGAVLTRSDDSRRLAFALVLLSFAACLESTVTPYCVRLVMP
jgi:uncharacterized membrane protein SpoIIM required for sporulation